MRTEPFIETPTEGKEYRVNLLERIKMPTRSHATNEAPEHEPTNPDDEKDNEDSEHKVTEEASATFEEDKSGVHQDPDEAAAEKIEKILVENPEELAELLVELGNAARLIFGPGFYEGMQYPGQERNDIREVVRKSIENEKANKEPTDGFNNYEKRLYKKWPRLQNSIQNIGFDDAQIKKFAKYLGSDIERVGVPEFISKHRWIVFWLGLELTKGRDIIKSRSEDVFEKKFGKE